MAGIEKYIKSRKFKRTSLEEKIAEIQAELGMETPDRSKINSCLLGVEQLETAILELNEKIWESYLNADLEDSIYDDERRGLQQITDKVNSIKVLVHDTLDSVTRRSPVPSVSGSSRSNGNSNKYKLPKIEIKKFNGEYTEWLSWWSQFEKIHQNEDLDPSEKFQYLIQSIERGNRAYKIANSFPITDKNYPEVIDVLKRRFGNKIILIEIYVRKLLSLVIDSAQSKNKKNLSNLYDQLESNLRALKSLGVEAENSAAFLYPLVESSLPEEVAQAWQRFSYSGSKNFEEGWLQNRLYKLMDFLEGEIEGTERLQFVKKGVEDPEKKRNYKSLDTSEDSPSTAAGLFSGKGTQEKKNCRWPCLFCEGDHDCQDCEAAQKMTLQEKKDKVIAKRWCFACLKPNHMANKCKVRATCQNCNGRHPTIICRGAETSGKGILTGLNCSKEVLMQTLMVQIHNGPKKQLVRAIMDTASQKSYILDKVISQMKLESSSKVEVTHELFGGSNYTEVHNKYEVFVASPDGKFKSKLEFLNTDKVCSEVPKIQPGSWIKELKSKDIWISDIGKDCSAIQLLIGADQYGQLLTGQIEQLSNGLTGIQTKLGWTVIGKSKEISQSNNFTLLSRTPFSVTNFWDLEAIGIKDPIEVKSKQEADDQAKSLFQKNLERDPNGRYSVGLPWNDDANCITSNKLIAEKRLQTTTKKLKACNLYDVYGKIFEDWEAEEIIEQVPIDDKIKCFYLPHRAVVKPESLTTPVRPVFDASCENYRAPSLNDCLYKGPNLMEKIPDVLLQFREKSVGVTADIRKAFQMIGVNEEDRDYLRFIWWEKNGLDLKVYRHRRVPFGVNASPFLLAAVIEHHLNNVEEKDKGYANKLMKSLYVDNVTSSVSNMAEYVKFKEKSIKIMADGLFELRQWEHSDFEPRVEPKTGCGLGNGSQCATLDGDSVTSVLGMKWNKVTDALSCEIGKTELPKLITKRTILSSIHQIFDPLGILAPALVQPKLLLQELWNLELDWDTEVPEEAKNQFLKWNEQRFILGECSIPRCMTVGNLSNPQLHMFCDASKDGYAAVVFLRTSTENRVQLQLVQAKTRVAPKKKCTIPRLELMGCTIGSRLVYGIGETMDKAIPIFHWTDSSTALAWIKKCENWGVFVRNRVMEINQLSDCSSWRHIPGELNPADLPSRGCTPSQLLNSKWWEGPAWLREPMELWPNFPVEYNEAEINAEKMKTAELNMINCENVEFPFLKFSKYWSNIKLLGWILRFVFKCKKIASSNDKRLSSEEIKDAEQKMFELIQKSAFPKVGEVVNGIKILKENGLIRVKSKLLNRVDCEDFRKPILLPSNHPMVIQLIQHFHSENCHSGVQLLMSKLRERFWIFKARQTIKKVVGSCVKCRRFQSKPILTEEAALPGDRCSDAKAFQITGCDLAGPLFLKGKSKVWIVIFTCAVYRAVHLELVKSLTTEDFILALTRFISRRGRSDTMYSDNGTNFTGTDNLFSSLDWGKIEEFAKVKQIKWKFIPPTGAWWGGFWERLIRSLKDRLKRMLGKEKLNYVQLETCLCEAEAVMNARPLTYVSEDPEDLIPLTPSMFIQDNSIVEVPELEEMDGTALRKQFFKIKQLRKELRGRFRSEYLGILQQKCKDRKEEPLRVGEVVLVGSDNKKRIDWPLAKVEEMIPGRDGIARVAWIRFANGGRMTRPVQRLYRLEVPGSAVDGANGPGPAVPKKYDKPKFSTRTNSGLVITLSTQFVD